MVDAGASRGLTPSAVLPGRLAASWSASFSRSWFFFAAFLRVVAKASWARIAILTASGVGLISTISWFMVLNFPPGVLQGYLDLPWPLQ